MAYLAVERSIVPLGQAEQLQLQRRERRGLSTSSGVIPGAFRISLTWLGAMSG